MKALSIRDVIGPVMIGPSSSHTAGAARIALMCRRLLSAPPDEVTFTLFGSFARTYRGHGTDRALVGGMLGFEPDDERIRDSFSLAREAGMRFSFVPVFESEGLPHPNTVNIEVLDRAGERTLVRGESVGGGAASITRIDDVDVELSGEYHSIVVEHLDRKGALAGIARCLSEHDINIATTRLFRTRKGERAYTVMQADDEVPAEVALSLRELPDVSSVHVIRSDVAAAASENAGAKDGAVDVEKAQRAFERLDFPTAEAMEAWCEHEGATLADAAFERERVLYASRGASDDGARRYLANALEVMRAAATVPLEEPAPSMGGLLGGEGRKLARLEGSGKGLADPLLAKASAYAAAALETNASMGRIVAAPTAGASGVLPAVLFACQDVHGFSDGELVDALASAAAVGLFATRNATVSGAEGGCQAEVGAASAMAAAAAVQLMGGTSRQCLDAAGNALSGMMGLVCDPVGGLVEAPCQKRNVTGAAVALASAQMALSGIGNLVDFDQTLEASRRVGAALPVELRETALGGLAATPAACAWCDSRSC